MYIYIYMYKTKKIGRQALYLNFCKSAYANFAKLRY